MKPMYYLHRLEVPPWHPFFYDQHFIVYRSSRLINSKVVNCSVDNIIIRKSHLVKKH